MRVRVRKQMAHGHLSRSIALCVDACACEEGNFAIAPCSDSVRKIQFVHTYKSKNSNTLN